jgi:pimeloyl-ACP methyl ester carboxylesterase
MELPSLLLIHGAANGAWVWDAWRRHLGALGWSVNVLDLRGHGQSLPTDMSAVTMQDYVADVESVASQIAAAQRRQPVIGGWSMGGLIAMMYAAEHAETPALLLFSPSPPLEVAGKASPEAVRATPSGPFGPELYGVYPADAAASAGALSDLTREEIERVLERSQGAVESGLARRQRKRGISVPAASLRCPVLVIYGEEDRQFPPEVNAKTAVYLDGDSLSVTGAGHWGIVYGERAVTEAAPAVDRWLRMVL